MKKQPLLKRLITGAFVGLAFLAIGATGADAAKTKIADVSQWQGSINWSKASKQLKMVIIRVKHGNPGDSDYAIDTKRNTNANGAYKYNVPFGQYDFAEFDSVADAKADAKQFYSLASKNAKFYVLDNEKRKSGVKGKEQTYVNAWLTTMRSLTNKPIVYYSYQNFVSVHSINYSKFDGSWIANYSNKPNVSTDLWQYTSKGSVSGISGNVDLNKVVDSSTVSSWYSGSSTKTAPSYYTSVTAGQKVTAKKAFYQYTTANFTGNLSKVSKGKTYTVKAIAKSTKGTPRIQLSNGHYITANKAYVMVK